MDSGQSSSEIKTLHSPDNTIIAAYQSVLRRKRGVGLCLLALLAAATFISIQTGSLPLKTGEVFKALLTLNQEGRLGHVLWNIRLPRTAAALLAGGGLGIAGAVMQNILKNPLASPFTIGVSQGAAFGAAFAIIILGAGEAHLAGNEAVTVNSPQLVVFSAFAGAILAVVFILVLASLKNVTSEAVILAGVALSAFFSAATMLLQYFADDMQVAATVFWTFGDLGKAGWRENMIMLFALLPAGFFFMAGRWNFNALSWGDDVAGSLGVRVRRLRVSAMILSALVVAVTTSFLGIIGFVGLMAPHLMRFAVGVDHRFLIPASAGFGALLLLVSDIIARTILAPILLPVGIVTSFAGAPLFLYLLIKSRRA
jgi:iron complex transport system permease protein